LKSKDKFAPIKEPNKIFSYWKRESFTIFMVFVSGIIYNVGLLLGPIFQGKLIDSLIAKENLTIIFNISISFVIAIAIVQYFRYVKRLYIRRFANNTSAAMRFLLYNNLIHKTKVQLEKENMGSLMTKAISDVDACVEGMRKFTTEVFDTGVFLVAYFVYMLVYDVKITLLAFIFIPVAMLIAEKLKKIIYKYTNAYRKKLSSISDLTYEQVDNSILYRLYGRENENYNLYNESLHDFEKTAIMANVWENSMQPIYNVIAMIGVIIVIALGGDKVVKGVWSIGTFVSYLTIFTALAFKASKAAKLFNSVQKATVSWKRIKPYLEENKSINMNDDNISNKAVLNIDNLSFEYVNGNKIIDDISLYAVPNSLIGITGPVACGKSTFGKIFLGEYNYFGSVQINGLELKKFSEYERSKMIAYMGHNPNLMSETIYNNITLGDGGDINEILKIVCLDEDLKGMKEGINTLVGNGGVKLSGGQQARVALARTLYRRTPIVILDDPFSAVDMKTERQIIDNLRLYHSNQIIILISHRLSIFTEANNIILMNPDKTYDYGTHEELINKSSLYNDLFNLQMSKDGV